MINLILCAPCRSLTTTIAFGFASLILSVASFDRAVFGQEEGVNVVDVDFEESFENSTSKVPWWHSVWYYPDGSLRYKNRFTTSICNRQYLLPAQPNVYGPEFGYHQTNWSQLPCATRQVSGETILTGKSVISSSKKESPHLSRRDRATETTAMGLSIPKATQVEEIPYLPPQSRAAKKSLEASTIRQALEVSERQPTSSPQGQSSDGIPDLQTAPKAPQIGLRPHAVRRVQVSGTAPELLTTPRTMAPAQSRQLTTQPESNSVRDVSGAVR